MHIHRAMENIEAGGLHKSSSIKTLNRVLNPLCWTQVLVREPALGMGHHPNNSLGHLFFFVPFVFFLLFAVLMITLMVSSIWLL